MYDLIRHILFQFPPERAHQLSMGTLQLACRIPLLKKMISSRFSIDGPGFEKQAFRLHFKNRVGLGAGFDKNARYLRELEVLGFGFVEIGTVTPLPQPGNEKPRLYRLPADRALINRMGFNNDGAQAVARRLRQWNEARKAGVGHSPMMVGGNIGKNKVTPNEQAWRDYETCFKELSDCVDYFVVNVSSPNTPGLRALHEKEALRKILSGLQNLNTSISTSRPLLLKIAPDLTLPQLDDILDLASEIKLDGLVATNTTIAREGLGPQSAALSRQMGGLSGAPLGPRSTEMIRYISTYTQGTLPVIASGGVFRAGDAKEKIDAGASLVQVWTGFIYQGPGIVKQILSGLY